jgi:peptidoglycan L-alanyl-D-glutamate endopeptidase CwlK
VTLNGRSIANLAGVHPDLVRVVLRAAADGARFIVTEGLRSYERQTMLVAAGKSRTLNSRHLHGLAVDLAVATPDGGVSWNRDDYKQLAVMMAAASKELAVPITWGGSWTTFWDGCHWELDRNFYATPVIDLNPDPTRTEAT